MVNDDMVQKDKLREKATYYLVNFNRVVSVKS